MTTARRAALDSARSPQEKAFSIRRGFAKPLALARVAFAGVRICRPRGLFEIVNMSPGRLQLYVPL
jgi:hypothetical protein